MRVGGWVVSLPAGVVILTREPRLRSMGGAMLNGFPVGQFLQHRNSFWASCPGCGPKYQLFLAGPANRDARQFLVGTWFWPRFGANLGPWPLTISLSMLSRLAPRFLSRTGCMKVFFREPCGHLRLLEDVFQGRFQGFSGRAFYAVCPGTFFEGRIWTWRGPAGGRGEVLQADVKRSCRQM